MNRKSVLVVAALIAGGVAVYEYHERILLRAGIESVLPSYYRAVDLAKSAHSLDRYHTNWAAMRIRLHKEGGELDPDGWKAKRQSDLLFLVTYRSTVGERQVEYDFEVEVGDREVKLVRNDPGRDADEYEATPR